jgi:cytochrome c biogenesis protein CcmG/thiol:disulfide interchange protein DsbE
MEDDVVGGQKRSKLFYKLAFASVFCLALGLALWRGTITSTQALAQMPVFAVKGFPGGAPLISDTSLRQARQPVVINFFASWCAPCIAEFPQLHALKNAGIPVIGIAFQDSPDALAKLLATYGNPFTRIGLDDDGTAGVAWGVRGVPETFGVDRDGRLLWRQVGELTPEAAADLARLIRSQ